MTDTEALTWATPPSAAGDNVCRWCDRVIYLPALPCSIQPVEGLLRMSTRAGQGDRCKYELTTRAPDILHEPLGL